MKVKDSKEFILLLEALAKDIVDAHMHYQLYMDLRNDLNQYHEVAIESNTFWTLTLTAHLHMCIFLLCRVYTPTDKSLHLHNWLQTIKENIHLFDIKSFRQRMNDNPFLESLAQVHRIPDESTLINDINQCSDKDTVVNLLIIHRNNRFVHTNAKNVISQRDISVEYPISFKDLETLLQRSITILDRYSGLFAANIYSTIMPGYDDYKFILKCVMEKLSEIKNDTIRLI